MQLQFALRALLIVMLITGCSLLKPSIKLKHISFTVASSANNDTPIPVDLVAVDDEELLKRLLALPAAQWFEQRAQLQRDFPAALYVWSRELVPGQRAEVDDPPINGRSGMAVLVFAGYSSPGMHRLRLDQQKSVQLYLDSQDMRWINSEQGD